MRTNPVASSASAASLVQPTAVPSPAPSPTPPSAPGSVSASSSEWIRLNVGGRTFLTTRSTLTVEEDSMLAVLFGGDRWRSSRDETGAVMLDREPRYFAPLLNYLRTGRIILDPDINPEGVLEEARFFNVQSAVHALEAMIKRQRAHGGDEDEMLPPSEWRVVKRIEGLGTIYCLASDVQDGGHRLFAGSSDNSVRVIDTETWTVERTLLGHTSNVQALAISSRGFLISGSSREAQMRVWSTATWALVKQLEAQQGVTCLLCSPELLLSGGYDASIRVWQLSDWKYRGELLGHSDSVSALTACGQRFASASADRSIRIWDLVSLECVTVIACSAVPYCIATAGDRIIAGNVDRTICEWSAGTGFCEKVLLAHADLVYALACIGPGPRRILSGSKDATIKAWNLDTWRCEGTLKGHSAAVFSLVSLGRGLVVSGAKDGSIVVWSSVAEDEFDPHPHSSPLPG
eukprot:tig00021127_g18711.t1